MPENLKFLLLLLSLFFFPYHSYCYADEKVTIGLFDEAVDLEHLELVPFLDQELMKELEVEGFYGQPEPWIAMSQDLTHFLGTQEFKEGYKDQVKWRNTISKLRSGSLSPFQKIKLFGNFIRGGVKYISSSKWRARFQETLEHLHGTHMAGMAVRDLDPKRIRLLSFPYMRNDWPPSELAWEQALDHLINGSPMKMRAHLDKISVGLKAAKVRVVNVSFGLTLKSALRELRELEKQYGRKATRQDAEKLAGARVAEMERFILSNPTSIFVLAAGNEHLNLDKYGEKNADWATVKAPNAVIVGGVNGKGRISIFSNYGKNTIDVFAPTSGIEGPKAGGGKIFFSGTSVSAAIVTNRFAKIFAEEPNLSAIETIQRLKSSQLDTQDRLTDCSFEKLVQSGK